MAEDSLSDKIQIRVFGDHCEVSDIKEFIRKLKEDFRSPFQFDDTPLAIAQMIEEKIDKLAGSKLIGVEND